MTKTEFKKIRNSLGEPQESLARALGVTTSAVVKWESGVNRIPASIEKLLNYIRAEKK